MKNILRWISFAETIIFWGFITEQLEEELKGVHWGSLCIHCCSKEHSAASPLSAWLLSYSFLPDNAVRHGWRSVGVGVSFTVAKMFPPISTSDLFAMKSFVGSDWLQIELGVALLQLLHAVLNKTGWENIKKLGKYLICLLDPLKTFLGEVPLAAWVWAPGLQASNVIRALDANLFIESWKVTSKLWCEDKTVFMLIS